MNKERLKLCAQRLADLLIKYAVNEPELQMCQRNLQILFKAIEGSDFEPPDLIPCEKFVLDGGFEQWPDLERAYWDFYSILEGIDED